MSIQHAREVGLESTSYAQPVPWDVVIPGQLQQAIFTVEHYTRPGIGNGITLGRSVIWLQIKRTNQDWHVYVWVRGEGSDVEVTPGYLGSEGLTFISWQRARKAALSAVHVGIGTYLWKMARKAEHDSTCELVEAGDCECPV